MEVSRLLYCFESVEGISNNDDDDDEDNICSPVIFAIEDTSDWSAESILVGGTESDNVMDFLFPPPSRHCIIALHIGRPCSRHDNREWFGGLGQFTTSFQCNIVIAEKCQMIFVVVALSCSWVSMPFLTITSLVDDRSFIHGNDHQIKEN